MMYMLSLRKGHFTTTGIEPVSLCARCRYLTADGLDSLEEVELEEIPRPKMARELRVRSAR